MKLDVYVGDSLAGTLEQADLTSYVFTYAPGIEDDKTVSLLMLPSIKRTWEHRFLHPVFQVSLPEGTLRQVLTRTFAKQFGSFGDTELLSTIGSHLVGRIKVTAAGVPIAADGPEENLRALLKASNEQMLEHYLQVHAQYSGVSGGFPKFLAKSPIAADGARTTYTFDHWIVKADDADHPSLVLNEYFCLKVCAHMGLPTPEFRLSDDGSRMAIRRFDLDAQGQHLGFEDMCALLGYNASDKFAGSVEGMIRRIHDFCTPTDRTAKEQFFAQYLTCMALRNGDAHLKNFGLLYSSLKDVRLAPVYDMVTMSAYAPAKPDGDTADAPALSLGGVRRWFDPRAVQTLAARCGVTERGQREVVDRLSAAVSQTSVEIADMARGNEGFRPMARRMLQLWGHGIGLHCPALHVQLQELAAEVQTDRPVYVPRPRERF